MTTETKDTSNASTSFPRAHRAITLASVAAGTLVLAVAFTGVTASHAQDAGTDPTAQIERVSERGGEKRERRGMRRGGQRQMLRMLDTDMDGRISEAEFTAPTLARFEAADADGTGEITEAEVTAVLARRIETMRERMMERFDADEDGIITKAEFERRATERFARADADDNGYIERREGRRMRHHRH